jgi:hypothetical protein
MISMKLNLFAVVGSLLLLLLILELVRRRDLKERYSLMWMITGALFLTISVRLDILYGISRSLGFSVPSNALFFFGVLFLVLIVLGLNVVTSHLAEKNRILTQEVVLLKKRVEDLEKEPQRSE